MVYKRVCVFPNFNGDRINLTFESYYFYFLAGFYAIADISYCMQPIMSIYDKKRETQNSTLPKYLGPYFFACYTTI